MATPAVDELVDEGVATDIPVGDGLVDEGEAPIATPLVRQPQTLTSLEAFEESGKQWDIAVKNNISLDDTRIHEHVLGKNVSVTREPPIGFMESLKNTQVREKIPFIGSLYTAQRIGLVIHAVRRLNNESLYEQDFERDAADLKAARQGDPFAIMRPWGPLVTDTKQARIDDIRRVEEWVVELEERQRRGITIGGRIAEGIVELPGFMVEFLLTGPFFKSASVTAKTAARKVLGRLADKGVGRLAVRVAGAGFGTLARTGVNIPRVLAGAAEQMSPDISVTPEGAMVFTEATTSPWSALARSFGDLYIENLTEVSGRAIGEAVAGASRLVGGKLAKQFPKLSSYTEELAKSWLAKNPSKTISQFLKTTSTKVGYDGILEEMGEERLGSVLRAATGLGEWDDVVPSYEDLLVEAGIFSVIPVGIVISRQVPRVKKVVPGGEPIIMEGVVVRQALGKPVTTEDLIRNPTIWISLFESEKNTKLSEEQNAAALEFIKERISDTVIPDVRRRKIIATLPDDFEEFVEGLQAAANILSLRAPTEEIQKKEKAIGFADPKTTRPGATTLINDAAVESVTIARDLTDTAIKSTKASSNLLKRNVAKAIDHIGTLGSGGKKISKDMDDIAFEAQRNSNVDLLAIKKAYGKMSHADRVKVSKLMNGYIKESEVSQQVAIARDAILDVLDRGMHEANKVGIRRKVSGESLELKGVGKAAPQVLNRKGIKFFKTLDKKGMGSEAVLQMAERMINEGQATSIEDAVTKLQQFRDSQLRGINPYFERTRIELPEEFIEWDGLNTLPRLLEKNWLTIEGVRKWGWDTTAKSFPKANVAIEVIRKEFGEKEADRIQRFINASFLGKTTASLDSQQLTQAMRDFQFITKIALSPVTILRNMADRLPKGQTAGGLLANIDALKAYPPVLNNFIEGSRRIEKNIIKSGAAFGHTAMAEDFEAGTQVKNIIGLPFSASELGNQIHIALVRKFQMERDINSLIAAQGKTGILYKAFDKMATIIGGSQKQVKNRLRELGNEELIEQLANGVELSGDLLDAVLHRTVRDKTFPILLSTKPIWWDNHPWARAAAQFKTWPVRQTQHIWNDVIKYTVKTGDISRMVRFLIATAMVGEVYNIARDFLTDRRESLTSTLIDGKPQKDVVISLLNAFFDGGGIGILADFTYGFTDWLIGPSGSTVKNVRDTVARIYKEPDLAPQAVLKAITKEVQPVKQTRQIINQVDREHFNKNNITKQYAKWRAEGYKWAREKRAPTVGAKVREFGDDFLFGKRQFRPGDDSLALEMAARQVMVGDLDDAADYLSLVIKRGKKAGDEELKKAFTKIQQSMRDRAPLGKVADKDLGRFFEGFSAQDTQDAINLTAIWFKNYADAITDAVKILKPEEE